MLSNNDKYTEYFYFSNSIPSHIDTHRLCIYLRIFLFIIRLYVVTVMTYCND